MKFTIVVAGQEEEIEATRQGDRLQLSFQGQTVEARLIHSDGAHFVLEIENRHQGNDFIQRRRLRAAGFKAGDRRQIWANGRLVTYERRREGVAATDGGDDQSLSPSIPAVVSEILVATGDEVQAGDQLILLESMKMILPIKAPYAGVVKAIHCSSGDAVQPGTPLVELEKKSA